MASASLVRLCFHCENPSSDSLRNGWDLSNGKLAQLCGRCYSIYESGRFCKTFHKQQNDWRECQSCSKPIHCSCLVSFSEWLLLEEGREKVICVECSKIDSFLARDFSKVLDLDKEIRRFEICRFPKCTIAPMFEMLLTDGDIDNKDGSIVIPKKYAEAYLPDVSDPHGIPLYVIDDEINEWYLRFHFWLNKSYVLDGLKEYMVSNKLQGGDTLAFSRLIPDGPYAIEFRKASTKKPSRKALARRRK